MYKTKEKLTQMDALKTFKKKKPKQSFIIYGAILSISAGGCFCRGPY